MYGVLIVTHGGLGQSLLDTAGLITGHPASAKAVGLYPAEGSEDLEGKVRVSLEGLQECDGTLCFVDIPGGLPARVVATIGSHQTNFEILTGVNLGMVVEALLSRDDYALKDLTHTVMHAGTESITDMWAQLREA